MQGDLDAQSNPVAESEDSQPASSEESASPSTTGISPDVHAQMNAMIRGEISRVEGSASKPGGADADDETEEATDGDPTPSGAAEPSDAPAPGIGRRKAPAVIADLTAKNTALEAELAALRPKPVDTSEEARKAARDSEQRYRRLRDKPDTDQDWDIEDWNWVQAEKSRRSLLPEMQQHYDAIIEDDLKRHQDAYNGWVDGFRRHILADMATAKDVPGVDFETVKAARTFAERDRLMYSAGAASHEAELKALREENAELKRSGLGWTRAPMNGGRSSPGRTVNPNALMNDLIRQGT